MGAVDLGGYFQVGIGLVGGVDYVAVPEALR